MLLLIGKLHMRRLEPMTLSSTLLLQGKEVLFEIELCGNMNVEGGV